MFPFIIAHISLADPKNYLQSIKKWGIRLSMFNLTKQCSGFWRHSFIHQISLVFEKFFFPWPSLITHLISWLFYSPLYFIFLLLLIIHHPHCYTFFWIAITWTDFLCIMLPKPWCSAQGHGTKSRWTDSFETVSQT